MFRNSTWQSSFMSMASHPLLYAFSFLAFSSICSCRQLDEKVNQFNLASVREFLTREEDSIVFSLIERAKYPSNFPAYDPSYLAGAAFPFHNHSLVDLFVRESEAVDAKAGRYRNPEEIPFFPKNLVLPVVPTYKYPKVLYPAAAFVNVSNTLWQMINYGRFVAEAKFRDAPKDYTSSIKAKDRDALMRLLTSEVQEETVKRRVKEKAKVFGQDVTVNNISRNQSSRPEYKVDPSVVYHLYGDWVIPLTKLVEVEYLLHRLD